MNWRRLLPHLGRLGGKLVNIALFGILMMRLDGETSVVGYAVGAVLVGLGLVAYVIWSESCNNK